jgi:AcrR family transcriptional regulator
MYRHFTGRDELMRRLADHGYRILGEHLHKAVAKERSFPCLARAYRAFAQKHPRLYHHMHRPGDSPKKGTALARYVLEPVARVLKIGINDERFLPNLRALRAYVHGFVSLEAAKQFPWGGDIEKAFERGLDLLAKSLD